MCATVLVGALLLGGNVEVPKGKLVGGDFDRIPLCSKKGQAGCVVAYSTFADDPDDSATFGNSRDLLPGLEVACTDPTRLAGRADQEFGIIQPSEAFAPGLFAGAVLVTYGGRVPRAPTTWVSPPIATPAAARGSTATTSSATGRRPGRAPRREIPPGWGTHTIDVQLGLGNLTRIVQLQSRTWLRSHR